MLLLWVYSLAKLIPFDFNMSFFHDMLHVSEHLLQKFDECLEHTQVVVQLYLARAVKNEIVVVPVVLQMTVTLQVLARLEYWQCPILLQETFEPLSCDQKNAVHKT